MASFATANLTESVFEQNAAPSADWSPWKRVGFRVAFLFFSCFIFFYGNRDIEGRIPFMGARLDEYAIWPMKKACEWLGQHVFHLTGNEAHWMATGSGDTALNWIGNGLVVCFALGGGLIWSIFARRTEYRQSYAWLRFLLRLSCSLYMFFYGLDKVFPLQMPLISVGILNEHVGQMSPMTMLWSLIGMNPVYEIVCGSAEVIGGLLLLFRPTALLGALVSSFVMTNVVLYNFFFDVPVKLFAVNLLVACVFLTLPDMRAMFDLFVRHKAAALTSSWVPLTSKRKLIMATVVLEVLFGFDFVLNMPREFATNLWNPRYAASKVQSPLLGAWKVDATYPATGAFALPEGFPATNFYMDTTARAFLRDSDRQLFRTQVTLNAAARTLEITCRTKPPVKYTWFMPDGDHLLLKAGKDMVALTREQIPAHYPLLDRGFHFVNEWGLER